MDDREKLVSLLLEIKEYFGGCRKNASSGSKAEKHFWELQNAASEAAEMLKGVVVVESKVPVGWWDDGTSGMPDREKVIRAVETCFDSWIDKHRNMGLDLHEVKRMKRDALELLKGQEPTVCGWVNVKDRLPESGKHVLLTCEIRCIDGFKKRYVCDGFYSKAHTLPQGHYPEDDEAYDYDEEEDEYYLKEGWYEVIQNWDEFSSVVVYDFVTHWMPLPEPPKEDDEHG